MQKANVLFILTLLTVVFMAASISTTPAQAVNWQVVTTITGSDSKTSEEFRISGSEWRIRWTYTQNWQHPDLTAFSFFVYPHSETDVYVDYVYESGTDTNGILNIHEGPKLYYVNILAANTPSYTLTVEYDTDSVVSDASLAIVIFVAIGVPIILIIVISMVVRKRVMKRKLTVMPPPPA